MKYEVRDVVCDYGVYENDELKLILNSRRIAEKIVELLEEDERKHRELNQSNIFDLKIYDTPKEPGGFDLNRLPQSWCYVEVQC